MKLLFLRHGKTAWNSEHRLQGRSDIPLSGEGIAQAVRAGKILSRYSFDAVFVSPLSRAVSTVQIACPGHIYRSDIRIAEWNFGTLEGRDTSGNQRFQEMWYPNAEPVPGAERWEDLLLRVSDFLSEIRTKYPDGTVLAVSHGGVSAAVKTVYSGYPNGSLAQYILPNATPVLFQEDLPEEVLYE